MTDIEDLDISSLTDLGQDEAIEYLRQLRLSRRTPRAVTKKAKAVANKRVTKATPKLNKDQAAELLKLLGG